MPSASGPGSSPGIHKGAGDLREETSRWHKETRGQKAKTGDTQLAGDLGRK